MSEKTLWEEGHWSADRVIRLSISLSLLVVIADTLATGRLDWAFDIAFVLICLGAALAVRPGEFFGIGVLPPLLLVGCAVVLSVVARTTIASPGDGFVQGVISALADHSAALAIGYLLSLLVLAIRQRVISRSDNHANRGHSGHSNRVGSPAP